MDLKEVGWKNSFSEILKKQEMNDLIPARVINQSGRHYKVIAEKGEITAILPNSYLNSIEIKSDIPTVGDWVGLIEIPEVNIYQIQMMFPRVNKISRKVSGKKSEEQIIASNIDVVFIVTSVDSDFNARRLERYLAMVYEIDAQPVILLNKIDKVNDVHSFIERTEEISKDVPIISISAIEGINTNELKKYMKTGVTIVLVGSSGVGKSTIINKLIGYSRQTVGETRDSDDKGRHITTNRELIIFPEGGMIIDNPGIREIQLWSSGDGISELFKDIEEISQYCKYKDCKHEKEPKCAVKKAVKEGTISVERFDNYKKLMREQEYIQLRKDTYERRKKDKQLSKMYRKVTDYRRLKGKSKY